MGIANCEKCQLVTNRKGEGRPGLKCPECNKDFCYNCAEMAPELCRMMRDLENSFWKCKECITKGKSLQSTLESIQHEYLGDMISSDGKNKMLLQARENNLMATTRQINTTASSDVMQHIGT